MPGFSGVGSKKAEMSEAQLSLLAASSRALTETDLSTEPGGRVPFAIQGNKPSVPTCMLVPLSWGPRLKVLVRTAAGAGRHAQASTMADSTANVRLMRLAIPDIDDNRPVCIIMSYPLGCSNSFPAHNRNCRPIEPPVAFPVPTVKT